MSKEVSYLGFSLATITEFSSFILKAALAVGCACLILYFIRIGYFPSGVSFGDSILLLMIAVCFGMVSSIVVGAYIYIGLLFSYANRSIINAFLWIISIWPSKEIKYLHYAKFQLLSLIISPFGFLIIYVLSDKDVTSLIKSFFTMLLVFVLFSQNRDDARRISKYYSFMKKSHLKLRRLDILRGLDFKLGEIKQRYLLTLISLIIIPLIYAGLTLTVLDRTMELVGVRTSHVTVYIKSEYAPLFVEAGGIEMTTSAKGYNKFKNITIAFSGFGDKTALLVDGDKKIGVIAIPNDSLIFYKNK